MKHLGTQVLETDRLILRKGNIDDSQEMFENWASDERVTRFLTWLPHNDVEMSKEFIQMNVSEYDDLSYYSWFIQLKDSHKVIGTIGADYFEETRVKCDYFEIGYCMSHAYWHQGIMSEAMACILKYLFEEVGAHRICSCHNIHNLASGKVMQRCGMKKEGISREAGLTNTKEYCSFVNYSILDHEYFKQKQSH